MTLTVACPDCSAKLSAPDAAAGLKVKCPKCGTAFALTPSPGNGAGSSGSSASSRSSKCPSCQRRLQVPSALLGQGVQCPACGAAFIAEKPDADVQAGRHLSAKSDVSSRIEDDESEFEFVPTDAATLDESKFELELDRPVPGSWLDVSVGVEEYTSVTTVPPVPKIADLTILQSIFRAAATQCETEMNLKRALRGSWYRFWSDAVELPPQIGQLTDLKALDLSENRLRSLPAELGQLTNLTRLDLSGNQLKAIPPEIGQLANLMWLNLSGNQLAVLPPEIGQLTNLKVLDLRKNQLEVLPREFCYLTHLRKLDLSVNRLKVLPPEIGQLTNLRWLGLGFARGSV